MTSGVGGSGGASRAGGLPPEEPGKTEHSGSFGDHKVTQKKTSSTKSSSSKSSSSSSSPASDTARRVSLEAQKALSGIAQGGAVGGARKKQGPAVAPKPGRGGGPLKSSPQGLKKILEKWTSPLPKGSPPPETEAMSKAELESRLESLESQIAQGGLSEAETGVLQQLVDVTKDQIKDLEEGEEGTSGTRAGGDVQGAEGGGSDVESLTDREVAEILDRGVEARGSLEELQNVLAPALTQLNETLDRAGVGGGGGTPPPGSPGVSRGGSSASIRFRAASLSFQRFGEAVRGGLSFLLRVIIRCFHGLLSALGRARRAAAEALMRCCGRESVYEPVSRRGSETPSSTDSNRSLQGSLNSWLGRDRGSIPSSLASSWRSGRASISSTSSGGSSGGTPPPGDLFDTLYLQIEPSDIVLPRPSQAGESDDGSAASTESTSLSGEEALYTEIDETWVRPRQGPTGSPPLPRRPSDLGRRRTPTPEPVGSESLYEDIDETQVRSEQAPATPPPLPRRPSDLGRRTPTPPPSRGGGETPFVPRGPQGTYERRAPTPTPEPVGSESLYEDIDETRVRSEQAPATPPPLPRRPSGLGRRTPTPPPSSGDSGETPFVPRGSQGTYERRVPTPTPEPVGSEPLYEEVDESRILPGQTPATTPPPLPPRPEGMAPEYENIPGAGTEDPYVAMGGNNPSDRMLAAYISPVGLQPEFGAALLADATETTLGRIEGGEGEEETSPLYEDMQMLQAALEGLSSSAKILQEKRDS